MEAGIVIVAGNLVETQVHVEPRPDPFATIDSAGFERRYDFAAGYVHNGGTQPPKHVATEPWHTIAQASERLRRRDLAGTPAAHLSTSIEAEKRLDVELPAERIPQLLTAAILDPREQFVRGEAERDGCEETECRRLLFPIIISRVIHIGKTGPDRIENFECTNERACRKDLDVNAAIARGADPLRQTIRAGLKPRRPCGPGGHHLQLSESLSDGWCREDQCRARGQ